MKWLLVISCFFLSCKTLKKEQYRSSEIELKSIDSGIVYLSESASKESINSNELRKANFTLLEEGVSIMLNEKFSENGNLIERTYTKTKNKAIQNINIQDSLSFRQEVEQNKRDSIDKKNKNDTLINKSVNLNTKNVKKTKEFLFGVFATIILGFIIFKALYKK